MPSNYLILCHPLLLLLSIFPIIRVFSIESALRIRWPKYWSISFSNSLSDEYSGVISFRIDWLDLFAVQGTLKSFPTPQFKSINSKAFFMVQLSHPDVTTGKTTALTRQTFVGKAMSLLFNMVFRFVTADEDYSNEIKRCLVLGRKAMTNLDSILKKRDSTLPTKVHLVKAVVFPVVTYGCKSWTIKEVESKELMLLNCGAG